MALIQLVLWIIWFVRAFFKNRLELAAENLAYRQQLASYQREGRRPKIGRLDRALWACFSAIWTNWKDALIFVQPATVCRWHRLGFRLFWRWKSTWGRRGRPQVDAELRGLIRRMSLENPTWGAPRILQELAWLGYRVAESTVAKYMVRKRNGKPPTPTWRSFLNNHAPEIAAVDFFVVPTATFRLLYGFVVLHHATRRVIHFNVTAHPIAAWTAQQIVEAFPFDEAPRYLLRDNDSIYGDVFQRRVRSLNIEEVRTAFQSPWQNAFVERLIGSVRRECLNHVIVLNEQHLKRILAEYFAYYNQHRSHQGLDGDSPIRRSREPPANGQVVAIPFLGGLHHRYTRQAA